MNIYIHSSVTAAGPMLNSGDYMFKIDMIFKDHGGCCLYVQGKVSRCKAQWMHCRGQGEERAIFQSTMPESELAGLSPPKGRGL